MANENDHIELDQEEFESIEKYVLGQLLPEEQAKFEQELTHDKKISAKVKEYESLIQGVQEASMREKMETFHQDLEENHEKVIPLIQKRSPRRYLLAAAIALLFISGIWLFLNKPTSNQAIFAQYYEPDPGLASRMSSGESYEFNRGMVDYKSKEYAAAITIWQDLHEQNPTNDTLNYFLGSAFLAKEQAKEAIPFFEQVLSQEKSPFYTESLWYLALASILNKDYSKAREYLNKSSHPNKESLLPILKNDP